MPMLGIVHTSFALVEPLGTLIKKMLPGVDVVNVVDDTLLTYARKHGVDARLTRRMYRCFQATVDAGADLILNSCSSVGETVDATRRLISVPILRIDEPMAEEAVASGRKIAVLATVASTLDPTCRLLEEKARKRQVDVSLSRYLNDGAFDLLYAGKTEEHDARVTETAMQAAQDNDVIVFAQASMARLVPSLEGRIPVPVLSSPERAIRRVAQMIAKGA